MNSSSRSSRAATRDHSLAATKAEPSAVLSTAEVVERLDAGTLTMAEYLPYAYAALHAQFAGFA